MQAFSAKRGCWTLLWAVSILVGVVAAPGGRAFGQAAGPAASGSESTADTSGQSDETQQAEGQQPAGREESYLLEEPKTPEALFDTVVLMVDFARLDLAKKYLKQLVEQKPDDAAILRMRDKHGPSVFFRLANIEELQPESLELLDRMNKAFRKAATDPKRLDALIDKLAGSAAQREEATVELRGVTPLAVPRLLLRLGRPEERERSQLYVATLVQLGPLAVPPLLGGLDADDPYLKTAVLDALGWLRDRRAVPYLWYPAFGKDQPPNVRVAAREALALILFGDRKRASEVTPFGAVRALLEAAEVCFRGQRRWETDDQGRVVVWVWDPGQKTVREVRLSPDDAAWREGVRLASQALRLAPDNPRAQALYLAFRLWGDARQAGWGKPLPTGEGSAYELALRCGPETATQTLRLALQDANPACAVAALQVLSHTASRQVLYQTQAEQTPLLVALNYPDLRVQFAAASAVLELDPDRPFHGARRVVDVLARLLGGGDTPRALTVDPNLQRATTVAGIVRELGYEPLVATTGREGFELAASRGDVELIVLHENTVRWELSQTVVNLRADARTAGIPIAIYGPDPNHPRIQRLLHGFPLVTYVVETTSSSDFKQQLQPFLQRLQSPPLTAQERGRLRQAAAFWLAHIATGRRTEVFDLGPTEPALRRAVLEPDLARSAVVTLGAIPTPSAQQLLADVAANEALNTDLRVTASLQLGFHIQRYGLLLRASDVEQVRAAWEGASDAELKTALAAVLGTLRPNATEVGRRLLDYDTRRPPSLPAAAASSP